jgi:hypothetical protein
MRERQTEIVERKQRNQLMINDKCEENVRNKNENRTRARTLTRTCNTAECRIGTKRAASAAGGRAHSVSNKSALNQQPSSSNSGAIETEEEAEGAEDEDEGEPEPETKTTSSKIRIVERVREKQ